MILKKQIFLVNQFLYFKKRNNHLEKNKDLIRKMFASISSRYDLLNHLLSLGFDRKWRETAGKIILSDGARKVLDVCAGTLDLSIAVSSYKGFNGMVVGTDFCKEMLEIGMEKVGSQILPLCADTLHLPFKDNSFDAITSAFGIRNIQNLREALIEMKRVIKDDGKAVILEFYRPKNSILFSFYLFYFRNILPIIGRIISGNKRAYSYLRDSVTAFLTQEEMKKEMELAGFKDVGYKNLTFGIVTIHTGRK